MIIVRFIFVTSVVTGLLFLAGCQTPNVAPATITGECRIFKDPKRQVFGRQSIDQQWISSTQETGIRVCAWQRPRAVIAKK